MEGNVIYLYLYEGKQWIKINGKFEREGQKEKSMKDSLDHFSAKHGIMIGSKLYLFGEGIIDGKRSWECWRYNF